jgi:hypothetical protein
LQKGYFMKSEQADIICKEVADNAGFSPEVRTIFCELIDCACKTMGNQLSSIILYGSAAEGKMRATSDINLLFILNQFTSETIDPLRETLRLAQTMANIKVMFIMRDEIAKAAEAFAMKFADIEHRHVVIFGEDLLKNLSITREAKIQRLQQVLLNLAIRLRERYAIASLREEQLAMVLADITGPLRVAAATILELQGKPAESIKAALERLAPSLSVADWQQALSNLSIVRETRKLPPGAASSTCFKVLSMLQNMQKLTEGIN